MTSFTLLFLTTQLKRFICIIVVIVSPAGRMHSLVTTLWRAIFINYFSFPLWLQVLNINLYIWKKFMGTQFIQINFVLKCMRLMLNDDAVERATATIDVLSHLLIQNDLFNIW